MISDTLDVSLADILYATVLITLGNKIYNIVLFNVT